MACININNMQYYIIDCLHNKWIKAVNKERYMIQDISNVTLSWGYPQYSRKECPLSLRFTEWRQVNLQQHDQVVKILSNQFQQLSRRPRGGFLRIVLVRKKVGNMIVQPFFVVTRSHDSIGSICATVGPAEGRRDCNIPSAELEFSQLSAREGTNLVPDGAEKATIWARDMAKCNICKKYGAISIYIPEPKHIPRGREKAWVGQGSFKTCSAQFLRPTVSYINRQPVHPYG